MKIAAACGTGSEALVVDRMLRAMRSQPWHRWQAFDAGTAAIGGVIVADRFSAVPSSYESAAGNRLLVSGVPIDLTGAVADRLRRASELPLSDAVAELQHLDGVFAAMLWHAKEQKLAIVTDTLGMQPLYMYRTGTSLLLATEVKALGASGLVPIEMDPAGWGAFLGMGHTIANLTLTQEVARVPPGSVLVYHPANGVLTTESYWSWPSPRHVAQVSDVATDDLVDLMWREMQAYEQHHDHAMLTLSGGHDSRFLLALLVEHGRRPATLTFSEPLEWFDFEAKLARRVAALYGVPVTVRRIDDLFSSRAYLEYVADHELASPSLDLSIPGLAAVLDSSMEAIWEGLLLGTSLSPASQKPGGFDVHLKQALSFDRWEWTAVAQVFSAPMLAAIKESYIGRVRAEAAQYTDDEYGVAEFIVRNRTRHRTAPNPAQAFAGKVLAFTPGGSKPLWGILAAVPYSLRRDHRLYRYVFDNYFPAASQLPSISGQRLYSMGRPFDRDYLLAEFWSRVTRSRAAPVARRVGMMQANLPADRSRFVTDAIARADADHPDLNADGVRALKASVPPFGPLTMRARDLVFYWDAWRRMMTGQITRA